MGLYSFNSISLRTSIYLIYVTLYFNIGGLLPVGFPLRNGQQMICQKFDKESKLGALFDHRTSQFATMYDTKQRIPVYSMVTVRSLGDDKWPSLPFMVDRSKIDK